MDINHWKNLLGKFAYPTIVVVVTTSILIALGIIGWNKKELRVIKQQEERIVSKNRVLVSLQEKINALKQQEVIFLQKKASAEQSLKEAESALTKLAKEKANSEGVISRAAAAGREETLAKKNLGELTVQINLLKAQEASHTKTILSQQIELQKLQAEFKKTKSEFDSLQQLKVKLSATALEYERVKQNLSSASNQYAALKKDEEQLKAQLLQTKQSLKAAQQQTELALLKQQATENALKDRDSLIKQIPILKNQVTVLKQEILSLKNTKNDHIAAENKYKRLQKDSETLILNQKDLLKVIAELKGEQKALFAQKQLLTQENSQLRLTRTSLLEDETELKAKNAELRGKNAALFQSEQNRLSALSVTVRNLSAELTKLQAEKQALQSSVSQTRKQLTLLLNSKEESEKLPETAQEYRRIKLLIEESHVIQKKLQTQNAALQGEVQFLQSQQKLFEKSVSRLRITLEELQKNENSLKSRNAELLGKNATLQQGERNRISELTSAIKSYSEEVARLQTEKAELTSSVSKIRNELVLLQNQKRKFRKNQDDLLLLQREYSFMDRNLRAVKEEIAVQENLLKAQSDKHSALRIQLNSEIRRLQQEIETLKNRRGGKK